MSQKPIDIYEYNVKIHEIDPSTNTVTLLFEEVDGNDGFAVSLSVDELKNLIKDGKFDEWAQQRVKERLELLKRVEQERKAREEARKVLKDIEEVLKKKRVKFRPKTKRG